jgi:hypothetical protein
MQDAKGSTAARDAATQGFTKETTDYMNAMKDIESRWDTAGAATQGELDKTKTDIKTGLEKKDIGILSDEQIKANADRLANAENIAKGIQGANTSNSDYMKLLQKNKDLYTKQVKTEAEAAEKAKIATSNKENFRKAARDMGIPDSQADQLEQQATASGIDLMGIVDKLKNLTPEERRTISNNFESVRQQLGNATLTTAGMASTAAAVIPLFGPVVAAFILQTGTIPLGIGTLLMAAAEWGFNTDKTSEAETTKYENDRDARGAEADDQNDRDEEAKKAGKANRDATNDALAKSGSIGRAKVAM